MYASFGVLLSSGLGAGAAMLALHKGHSFWEMFQVFILVVVCSAYNATILTNRSPKTVFKWGIASLTVSMIILIINLF